MWVCTVYRSKSCGRTGEDVIRVHAIGRPETIKIELMLGTLVLGDPELLALVQGEDEQMARDIAELFSKRLGLRLEL